MPAMQGTQSQSSLQPNTSRPRAPLARLVLIAAIVASFGNGIFGTFHFDDFHRVVANPQLLSLRDSVIGSSRPLTDLSFHLQFRTGATDVMVFHLVSLILHILAALFLFECLSRLIRLCRPGAGDWIPFAAALVWAVHPVQTEAVTYIVQRAEPLSLSLGLFGLWSLLRSRDAAASPGWLMLSSLAVLAAMLAKPVAAVFPLVLILLDSLLIAGSLQAALRARPAYYASLAASLAAVAWMLAQPHESSASAGLTSNILPPINYWLNQQEIAWRYVKLWFAPLKQCLDYLLLPLPNAQLLPYAIMNGLLLLTVIAAAVKKQPLAITAAAGLLLAFPTSGIIPVGDLMVERRLYQPSLALAVIVVASVDWLLRRGIQSVRAIYIVRGLVLILIAATLMLLTANRNLDYCSRSRMQESILQTSPHNMRARLSLISAFCDEHRLDKAYTAAKAALNWIQAVRSDPNADPALLWQADFYEADVLHNLGRVLTLQGEYDPARHVLRLAIMNNPRDRIAYSNLAAVLYLQGYHDAAIQAAEAAIAIAPTYAKPHAIIGHCYVKQGRPDLAQPKFQRAHELDPLGADRYLSEAFVTP